MNAGPRCAEEWVRTEKGGGGGEGQGKEEGAVGGVKEGWRPVDGQVGPDCHLEFMAQLRSPISLSGKNSSVGDHGNTYKDQLQPFKRHSWGYYFIGRITVGCKQSEPLVHFYSSQLLEVAPEKAEHHTKDLKRE